MSKITDGLQKVDPQVIRIIEELQSRDLKSGTGINAIPLTTDYANGWNDCRKEAYKTIKDIYDNLLMHLK